MNSLEKTERYELLLKQVESVLSEEADFVARMANAAAMIHESFSFWWTGFYRVAGDSLVLAPFQGPLACMRIPYGRGVCGTAWREDRTIVVPDVDAFPGHIACSSASRSEIVVPLKKAGRIVAVLDIDSQYLNAFDAIDSHYLEAIARMLVR